MRLGTKKNQKIEPFPVDHIKALMNGKYINMFAEEFHEIYHRTPSDLENMNNVFRKMIEPFASFEDVELSKNLIIQLSKCIIERATNADIEFGKVLLASTYVAWEEVQEKAHVIDGFNEAFEELFDAKYNKKAGGDYWPWSFDSFSIVYELGKRKKYGIDFFIFVLNKIFKDYFEDFLIDASESSIKALKKIDEEDYFEAGELLYEKAYRGNISYEFYDVIEYLAEYFPELRVELYNSIFKSILSDYEDAKVMFEFYILDILQKMADYTKYQSMTFEIKNNWKKVIDRVFENSNGIMLNHISNIFINDFNIPEVEVEEYIEEKAWELFMNLYALEEIDYATIYSRAIKLFSNKIVCKVVCIRSMEKYLFGN